ncbi:M42 family peptidase [Paludicola sp. MB14-C6]|uniref:M42 family metallopeptidase n=1 Tax=Paludihabitans sp. MB14-C6 TaxID=3070656 RepID=UPI0027DBD2BD|nr:M20/M25/M40 family metallo-hydrolase [Paludicola sp. MB14-C6]WMJ23878.1 M42 family peptidase [Paludicola sp. MB14-C6]
MFNNIKKLCELNGISGRETVVANEIINQIKGIATEIQVDNLGNVIAFKKGKKTPKNKIMLNAHTDEVGMIVTGITDDGMLRFATVGGVNSKVIIGRSVRVSEKEIVGVIGTKAVHMQTADEKKTAVPEDKLYIDIGAKDKEDAMQHVALGDSVTFVGNYVEFGDGFIKAKAIDDRAGCAILIEIMKQDLEYDAYFAFVVQEEVGLRGARVAAHTIEPDVAIVVESTASGDVADVSGADRVTVMGEGAVVSYMDHSTIYDKGLYDLAFKLAKEQNIACQTKTKIAGGNDAGAIHVSRKGVRTVAVSIPSRYIHSPSNVVKKEDVTATYQLALALTNTVGEI